MKRMAYAGALAMAVLATGCASSKSRCDCCQVQQTYMYSIYGGNHK
jgi:hypothetical protein